MWDFSREEVQQNWTSAVLGEESLIYLNHIMFYMHSQQLGTSGYQKHNQVQKKNFNCVLTSKSLKVTFILQEQTITIVKINWYNSVKQ